MTRKLSDGERDTLGGEKTKERHLSRALSLVKKELTLWLFQYRRIEEDKERRTLGNMKKMGGKQAGG